MELSSPIYSEVSKAQFSDNEKRAGRAVGGAALGVVGYKLARSGGRSFDRGFKVMADARRGERKGFGAVDNLDRAEAAANHAKGAVKLGAGLTAAGYGGHLIGGAGGEYLRDRLDRRHGVAKAEIPIRAYRTPEHLLPPHVPGKPKTVKGKRLPNGIVVTHEHPDAPPTVSRSRVKRVGDAMAAHPYRSIAGGAVFAGVPATGVILHDRKKQKVAKSMSVSAWGVDHGPEMISKRAQQVGPNGEGYNMRHSFRSQGMAFKDKTGRKAVLRNARRNTRMVLPGEHRGENWATTGRHLAGGTAAGAGAGALLGGMALGRRGAAVGALNGGVWGGAVGAYTGAVKVNRRGFKNAVGTGLNNGNITTGHRKQDVTAFRQLPKNS